MARVILEMRYRTARHLRAPWQFALHGLKYRTEKWHRFPGYYSGRARFVQCMPLLPVAHQDSICKPREMKLSQKSGSR
jgi:hypothetical protein